MNDLAIHCIHGKPTGEPCDDCKVSHDWALAQRALSNAAVPTDKKRMRDRRFEVCAVGAVAEGELCRLYIDDDDFHWDALLRISGDFESDAEKLRYAEAIAKVLSDHEDEIPHRPAVSEP